MKVSSQGSSLLLCLALLLLPHPSDAQQSLFDRDMPTNSDIEASLQILAKYSMTSVATAKDFLLTYNAEIVVAKCIWMDDPNHRLGMPNEPIQIRPEIDRALGSRCLDYIRRHPNHLRVVFDGWKGDFNFLEPDQYWDSLAQQLFPRSPEAKQISFDFDFKQMIRTFAMAPDEAGKTCEQHCKETFEEDTTAWLEVYGREAIKNWPAECAAERQRFENERSKLLEKYGDAPFTKILSKIDPTTIVVYHSVC